MYVTDIMLVDIVHTNLREIHVISPTANIGIECIENPRQAGLLPSSWLIISGTVLPAVDQLAGCIRGWPGRCGQIGWLHQGWS
jgi:hypothetical protein